MRNFFLSLIAVTLIGSASISATAQTLPQGLWSFKVHNSTYAINRITVADSTTGLPVWISVPGFSSSDLGLPGASVQVAKDALYSNSFLDISYGLTNELTAFATIRYVYKKVSFTEEYINKIAGFAGAAGPTPPNDATASGIGDTTVGLKYKVLPNFSVAAAYSGGILLTGDDYTEIPAASDGNLTLNTGNRHDTWQLGAFYDTKLGEQPFFFSVIYDNYSQGGFEKFLGNNFETDPGDKLKFMVATRFALNTEWDLDLIWDALYYDIDKKRSGDTYEEIAHSGTQANTLEFKLTYKPAVFFRAFASWRTVLDHQAALGLFEMPGRIGPEGTNGPGGMYQFGIQLFYK